MALRASRAAMSGGLRKKTGVLLLTEGEPHSVAGVGGYVGSVLRPRKGDDAPDQDISVATDSISMRLARLGGVSPRSVWERKVAESLEARLGDNEKVSGGGAVVVAAPFHTGHNRMLHTAMKRFADEGVERAVAMSMAPHFSCGGAGVLFRRLFGQNEKAEEGEREAKDVTAGFEWSILDRWGSHPLFTHLLAKAAKDALERFSYYTRRRAVVVYVGVLPPTTSGRGVAQLRMGDPLVHEVHTTAAEVQAQLGHSHPHEVAWIAHPTTAAHPVGGSGAADCEDADGFGAGLPDAERVVELLGAQGKDAVVVVPLTPLVDGISTLVDTDMALRDRARAAGIRHFERAAVPNDRDDLIKAMVAALDDHLKSARPHGPSYKHRCPGCPCPEACRPLLNSIPS